MEVVGIAVGVLLLSGGVWGWLRVRKQVRLFSLAIFGTSSLKEGLEHQADILGETPKSVSGMTRLCLPQIESDFPEFHWAQWRQRCENLLRGYLEALESQDISRLEAGEYRGLESRERQVSGISEELRRQTELQIQEQRKRGVREIYRQVRIYQTEIARYQREAGLCIIKLQSAVEYYYQETRPEEEAGSQAQLPRPSQGGALPEKISPKKRKKKKEQEPTGPKKEQNRYNMELVYVQDLEKAGSNATAIGTTCPNCGAPITRLGSKFCEYCGTGIIPVDIRVWKLHRIEKE